MIDVDQIDQVDHLFRETWPRAKRYPDRGACYSVATSIDIVKNVARKPQLKRPEALKHARLLLRHLPDIRRRWIDLPTAPDLIDQTEKCVRAFLDVFTPPRRRSRNPARLIAVEAQKAWTSVPGAKVPRSPKPEAPLCRFVAAALNLAGKNLSHDRVSDLLRERERRRR